jgi:phosphotransferase system, enzyme I, PtsP
VLGAKTWGKDISVCGEMAHDPEFIPFLLGIGIRNLSVDPQYLVDVQEQITSLRLNDAEAYAKELLSQATIQGTWKILKNYPPNERYQR